MSETPDNPIEEARRLIENGQPAQAIRMLQGLLRIMPNSFRPRLMLAEAYHAKAGDYDHVTKALAEKEFDRAFNLAPPEETAHMNLVETAGRLGRTASLREEYSGRLKDLPFARECLNALDAQDRPTVRDVAAPAVGLLKSNAPLIIALAIAAGLFIWFTRRPAPPAGSGVSSGTQEARGFILPDLDGNRVSLADYIGTKIIVLDFWATWCRPCRQTMPAIMSFHQKYGPQGVRVLSVNLRETREQIRSFLGGRASSLHVLLDSDGSVARSYGVAGIPTFIVIDRGGKIVRKITGALPNLERVLSEIVEPLL